MCKQNRTERLSKPEPNPSHIEYEQNRTHSLKIIYVAPFFFERCHVAEEEEAEIPETLIAEEEEAEEGRFFACYLLSSRRPRYKGHTYI
ncbi:unnamed protein product [Prunus brigantina]